MKFWISYILQSIYFSFLSVCLFFWKTNRKYNEFDIYFRIQQWIKNEKIVQWVVAKLPISKIEFQNQSFLKFFPSLLSLLHSKKIQNKLILAFEENSAVSINCTYFQILPYYDTLNTTQYSYILICMPNYDRGSERKTDFVKKRPSSIRNMYASKLYVTYYYETESNGNVLWKVCCK